MTKTVTIGDVCEVIAGQSPPSSKYNKDGKGLPFFQGKADFGRLYPENVRVWCSEPAKIAEAGDILISVRAPVGPTNICAQKACIGRGLSAIRAGSGIESKYLLYFLRKYEPKLASQGKGSTFSSITQKDIKCIPVPLPPLADQKYIVSILDQADALRQKRKEAMRLLDEYVQAMFLEMFGDPVTNPKGWRQMTLREVATTLKRGPFGGALKKDIFVPDGYAVYEQSHAIYGDFSEFRYFIPEEKYNEMKAFSVTPGDLIVSCSGTLGKIAEVPHDAKQGVINQALLRITLNNDIVLNAYFLFMFRSPWCQNILFGVSRGSGISNFPPMSVIKNLSFPIPDISYQKKFVSMNKDIVEIRSNMNMQKTELDLQFNALMQEAFDDSL